ncbi:MAG TPA: acyltransferase [Gemmataceae bacterium]|nr:acyltransferase [Gemmataceae bacterium]
MPMAMVACNQTVPSAAAPRWRPRELLKGAARLLALVVVSPLLLWHWLWTLLIGRDRALEGSSELLSLAPGLVGQYLRRAFLAWTLTECSPTAVIGFGVLFSKADARIGPNVYIGPRCHIGLAHIERDALLAAGVHVTSGARTHGIDDSSRPIREQTGTVTPVRIGAGAWIGSAAVVMADVGRESVVGAGAVVAKPLPDAVIAVGVPARVVRSRGEAATPLATE